MIPCGQNSQTRPKFIERFVLDLVGCFAVQRLVRAVLVVPVDDELQFAFEGRLIFGDRRETQQLFQRSVKPLHDGDAAMLADCPKTRQDVLRRTTDVLEVFALELRALINNQVFGSHLFCGHDAVQHGRNLFGGGPVLEDATSEGSPREMIDHIEHPPTTGLTPTAESGSSRPCFLSLYGKGICDERLAGLPSLSTRHERG